MYILRSNSVCVGGISCFFVYVCSMYVVYSLPVLAEPQPPQGDWQSQPRTCTWPLAEFGCASREKETPPVAPSTVEPIMHFELIFYELLIALLIIRSADSPRDALRFSERHDST